MSNVAANILNAPTLTGGTGLAGTNTNTYIVLRHIRIVNKTAGAVTASLFIGATAGSAAGTEFAYNATSIAANSYVDWYGMVRLEVADFLSGLASAATSLTIEGEGEVGVG
jgi:hypothetical protein